MGTQEYHEQIILVCVLSIHLNTPTTHQVKTSKMVRFCPQVCPFSTMHGGFSYCLVLFRQPATLYLPRTAHCFTLWRCTTLLHHYSLLLHCILMRPCRVLVRTCFGLSLPTSPTFIQPSHSSTTSFRPHSKCSNVLLVYSMHTFDICAMQKSLLLCAAITCTCASLSGLSSFSVFKWSVCCCMLLFM